MPEKPTVIVYGATSFTAKELLNYLDDHPQGDQFNVILSGRNRQRLDAVNRERKATFEVVECQLDDAKKVKELVARGKVVINLAGPFQKHNAVALVRECAATGKHYVDLCGESNWLAKDIIPEYHFQASQTGACIIPSCGFDSIPSDLSLYLALRTLQEQHPHASITKSTSFFKVKGSVSGGTIDSMRTIAALPAKERPRGEWSLVGRGEGRKSTRPQVFYELINPHLDRKLIGSFFFMFPYNRCIVRRSWALSRQSPEMLSDRRLDLEKKGKEPVHGDHLEYHEAHETGSRLKAYLISLGIMIFGLLFFGSRLTRGLVSRFLPSPGGGQSLEKLKKGHFTVTNVSETTDSGVEVITTCKGKGDPGYVSTCYMLAESALSLVLPPPQGTSLPPMAQLGGVLTPSTGLGMVVVERLQQFGKIQFDSRVVRGDRPKSD